MSLTIVWFKRDLRIADHAPLLHAARNGRVIPVYVIEPAYWEQPDTSLRQWQFTRETLLELNEQLSLLGQMLWVAQDSIENCLTVLHEQYGDFQLYSHQEFGNQWTRQRNSRVARWCAGNNVNWIQFQPYGVIRGIESRTQWQQQWHRFMSQPALPSPTSLNPVAITPMRPELWPDQLGFDQTPCPLRQAGGRKAGLEELKSFLKNRGSNYHKEAGVPYSSFTGSSRLSPYLSIGALSHREVVNQVSRAQKHYASKDQNSWIASMNTCLKRLQLHCHCIQQFDDEPAMEMQALHKSYVGLRENEFRESLFEDWAEGKTGFPLIDAAMRALHSHGWINFRLRALLVNFASYQLWLHWREPALHLARLMTDYEPGIHYPAVQSQAGTAGMRQWRIPDPVAQSQELDPEGLFIKAHCPELAEINGHYLHSPWLMSHGEQVINSCVLGEDYPLPVVNHEKAAENAWQKIRSWLLTTYDPAETERLIVKHGTADMVEAFQDKTLIRGQVNPESHLLPYEEDDS